MKIKITCKEEDCKKEFVLLPTDTGAKMPVNVTSLSEEDKQYLNVYASHNNPNEPIPVKWDPSRHVSHFKTCKNPSRFSKHNENGNLIFTGYFVFLKYTNVAGEEKTSIQSIFSRDIVKITTIRNNLKFNSMEKDYQIGKRFKLGKETILQYNDR